MLLTQGYNLPPKEQQAILLSLLDEDWAMVIRYGLSVANDASISEIVKEIETHRRSQRNILVDRCKFFYRVQEEGESFDDSMCL